MEDIKIIELFFNRDEKAIYETQLKYGNYCYSISYNILKNNEDSRECVNDTYLNAWNSMPPHKPSILSAYLGKLVRNLSIDRYRKYKANKRLANEFTVSLDELDECVSSNNSLKDVLDGKYLSETINIFLSTIKKEDRKIFVCRYFYFDSISDIEKRFNYSSSKVKMSLKRTRDKLKDYLVKEGYIIWKTKN